MVDQNSGGELYVGLFEALEMLIKQVEAYELAIPPDNYPAQAVVAKVGELARQVRNEAEALTEALAEAAEPGAHPLSPRELEVLTLAAKGLTNKEIAYRLNLSERTIQFHLRSVFNKTATNSRTEAVAVAIKSNWLP